jgi:hypothetical protein
MHRRLTSRGPSPDQFRDQQKATLIEENQVGTKSLGFFLSSAIGTASNAQSLAHRVVWIGLLASGNSTPCPPTASTHDPDDSSPGNAARLLQLPASRSRDQLSSLLEAALLEECAQAWLARALRVKRGGQDLAWLLIRLDLLGGKTGPILLPSSVKHSSDWLRFDNFCRIPASQSPGVFFFPIVEKSHLVSYFHDSPLS